MRNLTDIQFWFARVKAAFADQMIILKNLQENGELFDESFPVRMQAAYAFINDVDWRIVNTPADLETITKQIYKIIAFVGTALPNPSEFYNAETGNTNIVIGNGLAIPFATNTIYGKVRLSVPAAVASDPIVVGDNDPRLDDATTAYDDTVTGASINTAGQLVLLRRDGSTITTASGNILDLTGGGTQDAAISINGFIRTSGDLILNGIVNDATTFGVLSLGTGNVIKYLSLAQLAAEIGTGTITANRAAVSDGVGNIVASATTATQVGYLSTTTSDVQTQLNNKQPLDADLTAIAALSGNGLLRKTAGTWGMDSATYLTANQTITLSGDVTGSGSTAITATIGNGVVSFAKMQNINTNRLLGRSTSGAGAIQEIILGVGLSLSGGTLTNTITQYTDAMARLAISETITGIDYNNTTGVFSLTSGYVIPTTTEQANWTTAYNNSITTIGFNTANGNLTLTQQDGGTLVQDLDGRYLIGNEVINLSGDVTGSGNTSIATTIANDAVTFAKMQNVSSGVILGRSTAASGNIEEITVGTGLVLSGGFLSLGTITANRAIVSGAGGALEASTTTATQISYLSTLTSNVQTQLDGKQTLDATLTALAAIGSSTIGIVVLNGVDSFVTRVLDGSPNRITINNANGSATNPTIDIASTYTGQSSITTLGTITSGVWNGSSIGDAYILSAANWNEAFDEHINSISWNAVNGNLTASQEDGGNITVNIDGRYVRISGETMTGYLTLVGNPINANHAVNKAYADAIGTGILPRGGANAATTAVLPTYIPTSTTLTGSANGVLPAQDGVTLSNGDKLLVKNEASNQYNGFYTVTDVGSAGTPYVLTRTTNMDVWDELPRSSVFIQAGSTQAGYTYYCTVATGGTLGTTPVTFEILNIGSVYTPGAGIDITGNTISIDAGSIVNSMISASAAIALNKLAATTASRALVADGSGYITASATTATEIGYSSGVSGPIQTQINNKQPLDATLTALAAYNTNGILTQTAADIFVGRTITGVTNRTTITNGDGVSGNPVIDISATYAGQNTITILGTVATGVWQATAIADAYIASASNWNSAYNDTILSASFNTGDGVLTLTQRDTGSVTVDLDGRYAIGSAISGTPGTIAMFDIGGTSVTDSTLTQSGGIITVGGGLLVANNAITQDGSRPIITLQQSSVTKLLLGIAAGVSDIITGDAIGDVDFRTNAQAFNFSVNNGSSITFKLASSGAATFISTVTATGFIGNASTATALQTARTINGVSFDGTANITVTAAAGTLTGTTLNATVVGSSLTSVGTIGTGVWQGTAIANAYIASGLDAVKIADGSVTNTEFQYINTLSSNAQTQLDNKQALATNLTSLSALTYASLSFVKMTAAGTFALDTNTYLTANQTITLTGDVTGSGTTSITTTIGAGVVTNAMLAGSIAASKLVGTDISTVGTITSGIWNAGAIATSGSLEVNNNAITQDGTRPIVTLRQSGTSKLLLGISAGTNDLINGDLIGDVDFRTNGQAFNFSINNGSGIAFKIASSGAVTIASSATAGSFVKNGGLSTQFLKADGTVDTSTYLTANQTITLSGEASGSGATSIAVTLGTSAVTGKVLTGLSISGSAITAADSILSAFGKIQNQLNGLSGGLVYKGSWNANTNTPTLADGVGTTGWLYIVNVAGTQNLGSGSLTFAVGDWAIYNGSIWEKVSNTDSVTSVNGAIGAVVLTTTNISEGTNLYFTNARTIASTLTGYTSGAGTVAATDTILQAIQKLNGNIVAGTITIGSTSISLNGTATSLVGLTSVTSTSFVGALTGNASTATILQTSRNINGVSFNGSADITITAAAGTLTGTTLNATVVNSSLTSLGTIATGVWQGTAIANAYIGTGIDATKIADGSVTSTEFQYINTLSSNAQTQIDGKQPLDADLTAIAALSGDGLLRKSSGTWAMDSNTYLTTGAAATGYIQNQIASAQSSSNFWISGDAKVNQKVYIGTNGAYLEEVLVGSTYELRVVDSAGNITVIS